MIAARLSQLQKRILHSLAADYPRTHGRITSSHQEMAARGWMIIGRSSGGKAESLRLTPEGQKWAA
jgi:hypothetical protein